MKNKAIYIIGILLAIVLILIFNINKHNFIIIKPNTISLSFTNLGSTTKEFGIKNNCKITINGSYFGRNIDNTFFPAGLRYSGFNIIQTGNHNEQDPNLQTTIAMQQGTKTIELTENKIQAKAKTGRIIFNAGPVLFSNGIINDNIAQNISHRNNKYPRTIIVTNDKKEVFFVLIFDRVTLSEAAEIIEKQNQFGEKYDVINLDGGPSTSIYSKISNKYVFNEDEKLPIFFCLE